MGRPTRLAEFIAGADLSPADVAAAPLRDAADWIDRCRRFWDSSLTRLDAHLAAVQDAVRATDRMANDPEVPDNQEL